MSHAGAAAPEGRFAHRRAPVWAAVAVASLGALGAIPFFVATTFIGDDHLFLAYSRYAPTPLAAFVRDQHGGEFYRPLAMLFWWVLARATRGDAWPFATLAFALHAAVAVELAVLVRAVRGDARAASIAALLFFIAPATRDAAYWYSASTDLLATAFGLAALLAVVRGRLITAALLFAAACLSKETAVVVPVLAALVLRATVPTRPWRSVARSVAVLTGVGLACAAARTAVLHGMGQSGDVAAPWPSKLVQIGAGLLLAGPGSDVIAPVLAGICGCVMWLFLALGSLRAARSPHPLAASLAADPGSEPQSRGQVQGDTAVRRRVRLASIATPWLWTAIACLPLLAAPWVVGSRYFYMPSIGIAWLAGDLLSRTSVVVPVGVGALLAGLSFSQAIVRTGDVASYEARLSAARRAVTAGTTAGYTAFHIACGIKDLDLAIKNDRFATGDAPSLVVLSDVPASFIALPDERAQQLDFLLAHPPLPPSGAYQFGARRVAGLARRGDDPTIEEVITRIPDIRFIRLRSAAAGRVIWRDVTDTWRNDSTDE